MTDTLAGPMGRRKRAANASFLAKLKQARDADNLDKTLARLASGLPLLPYYERWLAKFSASVRDPILACEQTDSRFLPARYIHAASAKPLRRGASEAEQEKWRREAMPQAHRGVVAQRATAEDALVANGVPKAVAAIASAAGVPTAPPTSVSLMRAALTTVDAHLVAGAVKVAARAMPEVAQRADPSALWETWAEMEQRAMYLQLPEWEEALATRREAAQYNTPLNVMELWDVLEIAAVAIALHEEAERIANQHGVPALARHLLAMRDAIVTEGAARLVSVESPRRVAGADAAWAAMAEYHNVSVATLRQRAKELPQLLRSLEGLEQRGGPEATDLKKLPRRDPRQRGRR